MATASPVGCAESFTAGIRAVPFPVYAPFAPPPPPIHRPTRPLTPPRTQSPPLPPYFRRRYTCAPAHVGWPTVEPQQPSLSSLCHVSSAQHATQAVILQVLALYFLSNMWITMSQDALFKVHTALPHLSLTDSLSTTAQSADSPRCTTLHHRHLIAACWLVQVISGSLDPATLTAFFTTEFLPYSIKARHACTNRPLPNCPVLRPCARLHSTDPEGGYKGSAAPRDTHCCFSGNPLQVVFGALMDCAPHLPRSRKPYLVRHCQPRTVQPACMRLF